MYSRCASPICLDRRSGERGVALIAAVFVIVVLALVGTVLVRVAGTSLGSANRELTATRALFAARTAAEWGLYQALRNDEEPTGEALDSLAGSAKVNCEPNGSLGDVYLYRLTAEGEFYPDSPEEVYRKVEVSFWSKDNLPCN